MADRQPYLGPRSVSGERVPYLGPQTVAKQRTPYLGRSQQSAPAPKKSGGGGLLGKTAGFVGNLGKDVGNTAVGVAPGTYKAIRDYTHDVGQEIAHPSEAGSHSPFGGSKSRFYKNEVKPTGEQYKNTYGKGFGNFAHTFYEHPLGPILDALTVADLGTTGAAKAGLLSADRAELVTRSPRNIATGKGPTHIDLSATKPIVKGRQVLAKRLQSQEGRQVGPVKVGGGEVKQFGKQIQEQANQHALGHLTDYQPYLKATHRLSQKEWAALHIRAMDIHPDDLAQLWKGSAAEKFATDPAVRKLVLQPSKKLANAETEARRLSLSGEKLFKDRGLLQEETAQARPALTKKQAAESLGRQVKEIHGKPYYIPHTLEEQAKPVTPLGARGGGKGITPRLGSQKQNTGALALSGKMHLRSDVLGPEFLRRVKKVKYDEIHNALVRGAVRVTKAELDQHYGGKLPKGYEYIRTKIPVRQSEKLQAQINQLEGLQKAKHVQERAPLVSKYSGVERKLEKLRAAKSEATGVNNPVVGSRVQQIPATMRGEGETHTPIDKLIPNPEDLHDSQLAKDGFSTTDPAQAHTSGGRYYIVPKSTVKAATGEFTRSSDFVHHFIKQPLSVWRSAVLGLRVGFFTNNLIGNSVMYAVKTGGTGAIRDLFGAIKDEHGPAVAKKVLDDPATPPEVRRSLYKEFFPEQMQGTFGRTQSPTANKLTETASKATGAYRAATGALPKVTSAVAETPFRKALIRNTIRRSPEFRRAYSQLPKQTRSFEEAARAVLEGKGGKSYQRYVSRQVNNALGDYLNLSPTERNLLRNAVPFYAWYKAITTTTYHLAADTPLRANLLRQLGQIGKDWSDKNLGDVPSFLEGSIPLGNGKNGTKRVLSTQSLNPYATLDQLRRATTGDVSGLGINPFAQGALDTYAKASQHGGKVSPAALVGSTLQDMAVNLPLARLAFPQKPSKLYPNRNRKSTAYSYVGVPIKEYNPIAAALQKRQGR